MSPLFISWQFQHLFFSFPSTRNFRNQQNPILSFPSSPFFRFSLNITRKNTYHHPFHIDTSRLFNPLRLPSYIFLSKLNPALVLSGYRNVSSLPPSLPISWFHPLISREEKNEPAPFKATPTIHPSPSFTLLDPDRKYIKLLIVVIFLISYSLHISRLQTLNNSDS